ATVQDNGAVMSDQNLPLLYERYKEAQQVWQWGGREPRTLVADDKLATVFDPTFVRKSASQAPLRSHTPPVNPTFHLTATPEVKGLTPEQQRRLNTVAVLGVSQVSFAGGSSALSPEARQALERSVIPVLRNTVGTYLK